MTTRAYTPTPAQAFGPDDVEYSSDSVDERELFNATAEDLAEAKVIAATFSLEDTKRVSCPWNDDPRFAPWF
ncbi:hypothetical protein IMZ48_36420 [Candidatus Bathyarchaeota archaeon]|nr:hypothetical protein [Candidatus Bathyarchaeota archaeon]